MSLLLLALLAAAQPADTYKSELCALEPGKGLVQSVILESHKDESLTWRVTPDAYTPFDAKTLVRAKGKPFAVNNLPVTLKGKTFERYGLPRILSAADLDPKPFGMVDGVPFFVEKGVTNVSVVYALYEPVSCQFQPYQLKS